MLYPNAQAFKILNMTTNTNCADPIKTYKEKRKLCTYYQLIHKFGQCPAKEAKHEICQEIGLCKQIKQDKKQK